MICLSWGIIKQPVRTTHQQENSSHVFEDVLGICQKPVFLTGSLRRSCRLPNEAPVLPQKCCYKTSICSREYKPTGRLQEVYSRWVFRLHENVWWVRDGIHVC